MLVQPRLLEHVRAHDQVRVPVAAGVGAVGADAADLGGEVEDELRPGVVEQPRRVVGHLGQVVVARRATKTSWPSRSSRSTRCEPRNPPPPVTRTRAHVLRRQRRARRQPVDAADPALAVLRVPADRAQHALLPRDLRLPAGLAGELLVADAERHHVARARAGSACAVVTISRSSGQKPCSSPTRRIRSAQSRIEMFSPWP